MIIDGSWLSGVQHRAKQSGFKYLVQKLFGVELRSGYGNDPCQINPFESFKVKRGRVKLPHGINPLFFRCPPAKAIVVDPLLAIAAAPEIPIADQG